MNRIMAAAAIINLTCILAGATCILLHHQLAGGFILGITGVATYLMGAADGIQQTEEFFRNQYEAILEELNIGTLPAEDNN